MNAGEDEVQGRVADAKVARRALLRSSLTGFALTASGLFLPDWLTEAEARNGAANGRLGGRHGKDQRGREQHRQRRRNRDKGPDRDPPKGIFDNEGVRNIRFIVVNNNESGTDPVEVDCYSYTWNTLTVIAGEEKVIRPLTGAQFTTSVKKASLFIDDDRHIVWAKNPYYSEVTVEIDSSNGRGGAGPKELGVGATLSWQHGTYKIDVLRLADDDTHKNFSVSYES